MSLLDLVLKAVPRETLAEALKQTEERRQQLEDAIRWALGEGGSNFGDNKPASAPPFWWRSELRRRSGLEQPPKKPQP